MKDRIHNGYREAARIARSSGSSFPLTFWLVPPVKRHGMNAIYAFCRLLDDAVDEAGTISEKHQRLDGLQNAYTDMVQKQCFANDFYAALYDTIHRFTLPLSPFEELFEGMTADIGDAVRVKDETALWLYCDHVAGTVGRLVIALCGVPESVGKEYAIWTGRSLQLTNVLRDIRKDLSLTNRIYLPASWLELHQVSESDLLTKPAPEKVVALCQYVGTRCKEAYHRASELRPTAFQRETRFSEALRGVYYKLFQKMEKSGYHPDVTVRISGIDKLVAGWQGYWN
ncbi:MAG: squalene/phytoene synthase family protein [bacterium]|nr:squalene/phytoene synthase family protein [bacterium]